MPNGGKSASKQLSVDVLGEMLMCHRQSQIPSYTSCCEQSRNKTMLDNSEGAALKKPLGIGQTSSGTSAEGCRCGHIPCLHSPRTPGYASNAPLRGWRLQLILRSNACTCPCAGSASSASQLHGGAVNVPANVCSAGGQ